MGNDPIQGGGRGTYVALETSSTMGRWDRPPRGAGRRSRRSTRRAGKPGGRAAGVLKPGRGGPRDAICRNRTGNHPRPRQVRGLGRHWRAGCSEMAHARFGEGRLEKCRERQLASRLLHTIVGFQHQQDAERFLNDLKERLAEFALTLHPDKTRLIEFGSFAAERRRKRGESKPETFDFLGFTHYCTTRRKGAGFQLGRKTQRKRMRVKLREIKQELHRQRHAPIDEQGRWLGTVIKGYFAYFAVPTNADPLSAFRAHIGERWFRSLRRRSQRHRLTWERMGRLIDRFLPPVRVLHPWPDQRFRVKYSR